MQLRVSLLQSPGPRLAPRAGASPLLLRRRLCSPRVACANEPGHSGLAGYVQVKVESVQFERGSSRYGSGNSVVFLRVQDAARYCIPVHMGEMESQALSRQLHQEPTGRPMTHDLARDIVSLTGFRVTKVAITDVLLNTYHARIFLARPGDPTSERDIDARPSDAINLAMRFDAPMYVSSHIAAASAVPHPPNGAAISRENDADIRRTVQDSLKTSRDPALLLALAQAMAVEEQRFRDAHALQLRIERARMSDSAHCLEVAMAAALEGGRMEEAAGLRDALAAVNEVRRRAAAAAGSGTNGAKPVAPEPLAGSKEHAAAATPPAASGVVPLALSPAVPPAVPPTAPPAVSPVVLPETPQDVPPEVPPEADLGGLTA